VRASRNRGQGKGSYARAPLEGGRSLGSKEKKYKSKAMNEIHANAHAEKEKDRGRRGSE